MKIVSPSIRSTEQRSPRTSGFSSTLRAVQEVPRISALPMELMAMLSVVTAVSPMKLSTFGPNPPWVSRKSFSRNSQRARTEINENKMT